ncbi:hypothetical protein A2G06_16465 (plasmid) [Geobacter anodireducens]|nr:hypothetical protein A2G06_16465 [Geobacter anodireducens]
MILSIIALGVLILMHEAGHFFAARWYSIPVPEFSIGFGPRLFGWECNGTAYSLRAIPLGGYIKTDESLLKRPARQRIIVSLAGPAANLVFAYLAFTTAALVGIPQMTTKIGEVFPGRPAAVSGIQPADRVIEVDGKSVSTWAEMISRIDQGRERNVLLTVATGHGEMTISVKPEIREGRGVIGVKAAGETVPLRYGMRSFGEGWKMTWNNVEASAILFASLFSLQSLNDVAGPLYIAKAGAEQSRLGLMALLYFMGIISANLVTLNLLPIPVLDGGTVLVTIWERVFRRPLHEKVQRVMTALSLGLIVSLMLYAVLNDISRMVR